MVLMVPMEENVSDVLKIIVDHMERSLQRVLFQTNKTDNSAIYNNTANRYGKELYLLS